jgi:DNA polymerase-1
MVTVDAWLEAGVKARALMLMQVHDELVFEAEAGFAEELVREVRGRMEGAAQLRVPLVVDAGTGKNWDEAH